MINLLRKTKLSTFAEQKRRLAQELAVQMVVEEQSALTYELALKKIEHSLNGLGRTPADAAIVLTSLVERSGMLREPNPRSIDFIHNTFKEFLAGEAFGNCEITAACLKYGPGALVRPADFIDSHLELRTKNTIDLVGLDWNPSRPSKRKNVKTEGRDSVSDRRWANREEAWDIAKNARDDLIETIQDHGEDSHDSSIAARSR